MNNLSIENRACFVFSHTAQTAHLKKAFHLFSSKIVHQGVLFPQTVWEIFKLILILKGPPLRFLTLYRKLLDLIIKRNQVSIFTFICFKRSKHQELEKFCRSLEQQLRKCLKSSLLTFSSSDNILLQVNDLVHNA